VEYDVACHGLAPGRHVIAVAFDVVATQQSNADFLQNISAFVTGRCNAVRIREQLVVFFEEKTNVNVFDSNQSLVPSPP